MTALPHNRAKASGNGKVGIHAILGAFDLGKSRQ
jgi:hypothetical protein